MSIELEVQPYCENCLVFEPDVERPTKAYTNFDEVLILSDTIVRCKRRNTCAGIKRYLEREMKKGEEK